MSARKLSVVVVLLVLPALLSAQRRGSSGGGSGGSGGASTCGTDRKDSGVKCDITKDPVRPVRKDPFSTKDLQKENMVAFVLDKKKDLKLSDDEVKALKDLGDHLKDTLRSPMRSLDSISSELKRGGDYRMAQVFGPQYVAEVRTQYDTFLKEALTKLSEEHQKAAADVIESRRKELAAEKERP